MQTTRARGRYYIIEGPDLSGKSTVADRIGRWLYEQNIKHIVTPQPGATRLGAHLRQIVKHDKDTHLGTETEAMLYVLDNMAFTEEILKMQRGEWIISDRSNYISGLIYQVLRGVDVARLDLFYSIIPSVGADGIFILNASPKALKIRAKARSDRWDRYESNPDFMDAVHRAYDTLLKDHHTRLSGMLGKGGMLHVVDANRSIEEVSQEIIDKIDKQEV